MRLVEIDSFSKERVYCNYHQVSMSIRLTTLHRRVSGGGTYNTTEGEHVSVMFFFWTIPATGVFLLCSP